MSFFAHRYTFRKGSLFKSARELQLLHTILERIPGRWTAHYNLDSQQQPQEPNGSRKSIDSSSKTPSACPIPLWFQA